MTNVIFPMTKITKNGDTCEMNKGHRFYILFIKSS